MAKLTYTAITSLDGFIEDAHGSFDWGEPDTEVHSFVNELQRPVGTYLYGRKMYEVMVVWDQPNSLANEPPHIQEFARIWQAADKIVYSRSLAAVASSKTQLKRRFKADEVRRIKLAHTQELSIGGAELASKGFEGGLIDECRLLVVPTVIGSGKPCLPRHQHLDLALLEQRRFASGTVYLRYKIKR